MTYFIMNAWKKLVRFWQMRATIVALASLLIVGIPWLIRVPSVKVYLTIATQAVVIEPADTLFWRDRCRLDSTVLEIKWLDSIFTPFREDPIISKKGAASLRLFGYRTANLSEMKMDPGGVIEIVIGDDSVMSLYARNNRLSGVLQIADNGRYIVGTEDKRDIDSGAMKLDFPRSIGFRAGNSSKVSASLSLKPIDPIIISDLPVCRIGFYTKTSPVTSMVSFRSAILRGSLALPEVDRTYNLDRGIPLSLVNPEGRIIEMRIKDDLQLAFVGKADRVLYGPEGHDSDLTPTFLDYFYSNHRIILLFTGVTFIWGLIRSIKKS